ncbi:MAG: ThuA domain-containing protein [Planctomycetes bacterium]|nr:ThuA domain-containing protein [Planctomycetota bacterium]
MIALALLLLGSPTDQISGKPYERLATREATELHMRELLQPARAKVGAGFVLAPFPYAGFGKNELARPEAVELELSKMNAGGPGPDLAQSYTGKNGASAKWRSVGAVADTKVDFKVFHDAALDNDVFGYLYFPIECTEAGTYEFDCGSDDGLRLWVNGKIIADHDVPRSLDPHDEHLRLELQKGTNHVLAKVGQGNGEWEFQLLSHGALPPEQDAQLEYYLERDFPAYESRAHYRAITIPVPQDIVLECGGLDFLPDGRPIVCTRRGDVYAVGQAYEEPPAHAKFERFASGLHEALGLAVRKEAGGASVYCVQRGELTRLRDRDGDGAADLYQSFCNDWGVSGNYHEFAFGPKFDAQGNAWVTLNVGFCGSLGKSIAPYRGWALKITPKGEMIPVCDGLRSPNGIGVLLDGTVLYADNQGDYVATNKLAELRPGSWHGHPASLRWRTDLASPGERPPRMHAAILFPYQKLGQSVADIAVDTTGGKFGPFAGQVFCGDQMQCSVERVFLEKIEGDYQGACFAFVEGLDSGVNRVAFAPDGSMFVGETDRGWGSTGNRSQGLERIVYTGKLPFEMLAMRAKPDGFELEFTSDVDAKSAADPASYRLARFTYEYHADYGAPEANTTQVTPRRIELVGKRKVKLTLRDEDLVEDYVYELSAAGLRAAAEPERALLHDQAWYTLANVPGRAAQRAAAKLPRVLFLTHSAGFVHDVVKRPDPFVLSLAEEKFTEMSKGVFEVECTQDCSAINAANLARFDAVMFYTTGELPIPDAQRAELMDWIEKGHAFVGVHCATDTLYQYAPYQAMVGGAFDGHPWHEKVGIRVLDPDTAATAHLGARWELSDEIYQFKNFVREPLRLLLALDDSSIDASKGNQGADGLYANSWMREWGEGRVFYTALGHEPALWKDERFRKHLLGGLDWAIHGPDLPAPVPPGAQVFFDGRSLEAWRKRDGDAPAEWKLSEDFMESKPGSGDIQTRADLGSGWLHVEFMVPKEGPEHEGQERGNSGVYVEGRYEVQVLDSYGLKSGDGDCGAIYGKSAPSTNACRKPMRWQTYDIRFRSPKFGADGKKSADARFTVWHNGIEIQHDVDIDGVTGSAISGEEADAGPLLLQDHGHLVRYRNIWFVPDAK